MAATSLPPGRFQFTSVGELGAGGLGRVDRIRVTASNAAALPIGSELARKRLNQNWAANPTMRERFDREIRALQKMSHGSVVTCEGENIPGEERFYVMPVYASTMRRWIAGGGKLGDWKFTASLGITLAEALHYAHGLGFIHRDLKPDNILFNPGKPLVIADWGLGYFVHKNSVVLQQLTRGGMGTEYYCSLEQWSTGKCDARGDIYSLGMTLDECVTGRQRQITVGMGISGGCTADTSPGASVFNELLRSMTKPFAAARPSSMLDVLTQLRRAHGLG
jgi:serine/threonine-protein kinase